MNEIKNFNWVDYFLQVSKECKNDLKLWFRYLGKYHDKLNTQDFENLFLNENLSKLHRVILQQTKSDYSLTREYIKSLNSKKRCFMKNVFWWNVFSELNRELIHENISTEIICAGGYALQYYDFRGTRDVDAFYESSIQLENCIRRVGDKLQINKPDELWLNNSIQKLNKIPDLNYTIVGFKFKNLLVRIVTIEYLIGMKLFSNREIDLKDISSIVTANKYDPLQIYNSLLSMGFSPDIGDILTVFGEAKGLTWLAKFYEANEDILLKYF